LSAKQPFAKNSALAKIKEKRAQRKAMASGKSILLIGKNWG